MSYIICVSHASVAYNGILLKQKDIVYIELTSLMDNWAMWSNIYEDNIRETYLIGWFNLIVGNCANIWKSAYISINPGLTDLL
jgi:hypothetical protein